MVSIRKPFKTITLNKNKMKKEKPVEITKEEQEILDQRREAIKRENECSAKINEVLQEFGMNLVVNPNSPLNNLQIIVTPKQK